MKQIDIVLLGFGNVGQSLLKLLADNDGYSREGVRLRLQSVFDRRGGILAGGHEMSKILEAKRSSGSVTSLEGAGRVELTDALAEVSEGILVDTSIGSSPRSRVRGAADSVHPPPLAFRCRLSRSAV